MPSIDIALSSGCSGEPSSSLGPATETDLLAINAVIASAVASWPLSERLKRHAAPVLQYDGVDFKHMQMIVCRHQRRLVGVAGVDDNLVKVDSTRRAITLHGIYVAQSAQGYGIGRRLLVAVETSSAALAAGGIVVKAERVSRGFFESCGFEHHAPRGDNDYPYWYWKAV